MVSAPSPAFPPLGCRTSDQRVLGDRGRAEHECAPPQPEGGRRSPESPHREPEPTLDSLMKHLPGPDFPTGGFVVGRDGIRQMYETGRGRIVMRARIVKEARRGGKEQLVVTELHTRSRKLGSPGRSPISPGEAASRTSPTSGTSRTVTGSGWSWSSSGARRPPMSSSCCRRKPNLESTFGAIMIALDDGEPQEFTLIQLLERFRDHRVEVIQRRSQYDLEKAQAGSTSRRVWWPRSAPSTRSS